MKRNLIILFSLLVCTLDLIAQGTQIFTSSGTWTCPSGVTKATVECWGGGGGGGGAGSANNGGSGGGSGSYVKKIDIDVVPCSSYTVVVGSGGLGGSGFTASFPAGEGGASYFGGPGILYAKGGCGGIGNRGAVGVGGCSFGSTGTCFNTNSCVPNMSGFNSTFSPGNSGNSGSSSAGGAGGNAPSGGSGGATKTSCGAGNNGSAGGGGGGAFYSSTSCFIGQSGGNGGAGRVRITWTGGTSGSGGPTGGSITGPSSVCEGATGIKYTYKDGTPASTAWKWELPKGATVAAGQNTKEVTVNWGISPGEVSVIPSASGADGCPVTKNVTLTFQPIGPTLASRTPDSDQFIEGQGASATFSDGAGGIGCTDEYTFSIDGGPDIPYTPGATVGADATNSIVIKGRRGACTAGLGCNDTNFETLVSWTKGNPTQVGQMVTGNQYFSIQPNPVSDMLNLRFRPGFIPSSIQIFDSMGRLLDAVNSSNVNVASLKNGIYHLAVTAAEGRFVKAFVITH